jgi:hypothetical protein
LPQVDADFITLKYAPELKIAMKDVKISVDGKFELVMRGTGMMIKMLYAFVW